MQELRGRLLYFGWRNRPWRLVADDGEIDLFPTITSFFSSLNGKRVSYKKFPRLDGCVLKEDEDSELRFECVPSKNAFSGETGLVSLFNVPGFPYLDSILIYLSGRLVRVRVEDGEKMEISADMSEEVFGVYLKNEYTNSCEILCGIECEICKIEDSEECCVFLSAPQSGLSCEKFNLPIARALLERLARGNPNAGRIGNCALLGNK